MLEDTNSLDGAHMVVLVKIKQPMALKAFVHMMILGRLLTFYKNVSQVFYGEIGPDWTIYLELCALEH